MRAAVQRGLDRLAQDPQLVAAAAELRILLAEQPETVELRDGSGIEVQVPLRGYLEVALWPSVESAFAELGRELALALQDIGDRIGEVERTLDYYVLAVQRQAAESEGDEVEELARTGSARVERLIADLDRRAAGWARRAKHEFVELCTRALEDSGAPYRSHRPDLLLGRLAEIERQRANGAAEPGVARRGLQLLERTYQTLRPLAGQLVEELHVLHAEQPSEPARIRTLVDPGELGAELPLGYRRLFVSKTLDSAELYVHRPALERSFADAIARWRNGLPQRILVHGDRGAGKRTLTNHVLARLCGEASFDIHWLRLGPSLRDEVTVARALAVALGDELEPHRFAEITVASDSNRRTRVIVVENAERLLTPSPIGIARMTEFLALVGRSAASTLWVLLMATPAANLFMHRLRFGDWMPTVIQVDDMNGDELRALVVARHRLSGFEIEFEHPKRRILDRLTRLRTPSASELFYGGLLHKSGGNPRQALYTWLECARLNPRHPGRIVVEPPPNGAGQWLPSLPLTQRLILAVLAQHGSLTCGELATALATASRVVEGELGALWAEGLLLPSREHEQHWTLAPMLAHPLVMELRSNNMI
jgi:hypothetical protein